MIVALLLSLSQALAIAPDTTDARAIMTALEDQDNGDKSTSRLHITITDKSGRERTRTVQSRRMDFEEGSKQLMLFEAPADVRGAGLLSVDFDDGTKADDQWLYLPSLARTTRISGSDKSGSFMGTDLTYSDMTSKDISEYDYAILDQEVTVDGEVCWLIESRPKTEAEQQETGYIKSQMWVSKAKLLVVQTKSWVREGKKLKYTKFGNIEKIDGYWVPQQIVVRTVKGGEVESQSTLVFSDMRFNVVDVTEADFTERRLEQGL